ncbi:MAG TPA: AbrB/MazE/SpoVT family DNA-binding domain-containing protein [Terriglobales bacterium]|nr:AbrB/MazE/SpoVT family DNA-binding domain-containing protein [Terriglobales bacterium]
METRVSTKGQVVLPGPIRRRLGLRAGDPLDARVHRGRIVLTPRRTHPLKVSILADPLTGLPVLSAGPLAPLLSSDQVEEILSDFP